MLTFPQIIAAFVLPPILVLLGMFFAWRAWTRDSNADGRWIAAPLVAAGFAIAFCRLITPPPWPPGTGSVLNLLFYFAIAIGLLGLLDACLRPPLWLRAILLLLLWRMAVRLLLLPQVPRNISPSAAELSIDAASFIALGWALAVETLAERVRGITVPLVLGLLSSAAAVIVGAAWHIQGSGQLAGSLAVISFSLIPLTLWRQRVSLSRGGALAIALLLQILLVHAYFYTSDTLAPSQQAELAIFLLCPLLPFAADLPGIRRWPAPWRWAVRILPLLIAVALLSGLTIRDYLQAERNQAAQQDD